MTSDQENKTGIIAIAILSTIGYNEEITLKTETTSKPFKTFSFYFTSFIFVNNIV